MYSDKSSSKAIEAGEYEMDRKNWSSQLSVATTGSRHSLHSVYTIHSSYVLPILTETPDPHKKPPDYLGFSICSIFCNPLFGIFAILLSEKSRAYYHRCKYRKAALCGTYAYGVALGGLICTTILLLLIAALLIWSTVPYVE
uniref:Uncharacterized protein n=1 Tax=Octopus bimaculoides TaxID=37653 RepID=A0A0L8G3E2_OCTBM|eukprot:XP_014784773.1 PREDICTED: uncharacterized protein LOC106879626 [Octopus bimaculoides]